MKNFFSKYFGKKNEDKNPDIKFGRYSDSYKEDEKYDAWDLSLIMYEKGNYLDAYEQFLIYLQDKDLGNLTYHRSGSAITFSLLQGSKEIKGSADAKRFKAEAKIAMTDRLEIGFLRRLIEQNYRLEYTRFALDEDDGITMVFDTYALDASPYKLYYALKELATNADKQDDILVAEFDCLHPVNTYHIREISDREKEAKFKFFKSSIQNTLDIIDNSKLNIIHYPGAASYLFLQTVYKLDFLLKPEGMIMESLEQIQQYFFKNKIKNAQEKNQHIYRELRKLLDTDKTDFFLEIYEVVCTFGLTLPSGHERLRNLIQSELGNMDWYENNGHLQYACAIPDYIVGYCLYNYALPKPDKDLLLLYYRIVEDEFFRALGFDQSFFDKGKLSRSSIIKEIKKIRNLHLVDYPKINIQYRMLDFSNECRFRRTYLKMMINMDLNKAKNNN